MPRILLVETDEDVRMLVSVILRHDGHEVIATADGRSALEALERESFPCVVVGSPVTIEGGEGRVMFLEYIEQYLPDSLSSIVVVTTWIDSSRVISVAQRLDACAVFAKPFRADELLAAVGECAAGRKPAQRWYGIPGRPELTHAADQQT